MSEVTIDEDLNNKLKEYQEFKEYIDTSINQFISSINKLDSDVLKKELIRNHNVPLIIKDMAIKRINSSHNNSSEQPDSLDYQFIKKIKHIRNLNSQITGGSMVLNEELYKEQIRKLKAIMEKEPNNYNFINERNKISKELSTENPTLMYLMFQVFELE